MHDAACDHAQVSVDSEYRFCRIDTVASTPTASSWMEPPPTVALSNSDIHIYAIPIDLPGPQVAALEVKLPSDEQERARRFKFVRDRTRFVLARSGLRSLLGMYCDVDPKRLQLSNGEFDKPFLADMDRGERVHFNLSRSDGLALVAIRLGEEVGVDIERTRPVPAAMQIAARFFSTEECRTLGETPDAQRDRVFLEYWTRKEALVKAVGRGLSHPLNAFTVSLEQSASIVTLYNELGHPTPHTLYALPPHSGYVAALATAAPQMVTPIPTAGPGASNR